MVAAGNSKVAAGLGHVDGVLHKDDGIVAGESQAAAANLARGQTSHCTRPSSSPRQHFVGTTVSIISSL